MNSDLFSGKFFNTVTDTDRRKWVKELATKDGLVGVMFLGPPTEFLNPLLTKRKYKVEGRFEVLNEKILILNKTHK